MNYDDHIHRDAADRVRAVVDAVNDNKLDNVACLAGLVALVRRRRVVDSDPVPPADIFGSSEGESVRNQIHEEPLSPAREQDDPIAELEALGGRIIVHDAVGDAHQLWWFVDPAAQELICGKSATVGSIRAAAARLLERVRGAK